MKITIAGTEVEVLVPSRQTQGQFTVCRITTAPGAALPQHAHSFEDCYLLVLKGEFLFTINGQETRAPEGTFILVPRETVCRIKQTSPARAQLLVLASPGGLDMFVDDAQYLKQDVEITDGTVISLLEKHGIRLAIPDAETGV